MISKGKINQQAMPIKNMFNMLRNSGNPQAMLNQLVQNNPQYKQVAQYINENGGDAKSAFYKLANQSGVNPDEIINMLK